MKEETFEEILRCIHLPLGELLSDNTTYRVTYKDFLKIKTKHSKELKYFKKFLVLTSDGNTIVGGILFYEDFNDIQAITFPEYRGMHYMSKVHKNGILESECYPGQEASLSIYTIKNYDDFCMKHYLLSRSKIKIKNLPEIHEYFNIFAPCDEYKGFQEKSLDEFIKQFS